MTRDQDHARLLLPYDLPLLACVGGQLPPIPALWDRAKLFFGRVVKEIGDVASFSKRWQVRRRERSDLLCWLEPVEKLARACLVTRAVTFLLMTFEGRKLMRDTPKSAMPERPRPVAAKAVHKISMPYPGWFTIAENRKALAEREKIEAQRAAARAARDRHDPAGWGCSFRVLGWKFPKPEREPVPKTPPKPPRRVSITCLDIDSHWPRVEAMPRPAPRDKDSSALILARRIESLSRVLADPGRATYRLARAIARLPRQAIEDLREIFIFPRRDWTQGFNEARQAAAHVRRAATALIPFEEPG